MITQICPWHISLLTSPAISYLIFQAGQCFRAFLKSPLKWHSAGTFCFIVGPFFGLINCDPKKVSIMSGTSLVYHTLPHNNTNKYEWIFWVSDLTWCWRLGRGSRGMDGLGVWWCMRIVLPYTPAPPPLKLIFYCVVLQDKHIFGMHHLQHYYSMRKQKFSVFPFSAVCYQAEAGPGV